jgi:hypothetical protein
MAMEGCKSKPEDPAFNDAITALRELPTHSADVGGGQASTLGPSRLLVFDFDKTIARYHVWNKYQNKPLNCIPVSEDMFVDLPAFREFIEFARGLGHQVAIATFGRKDVVNKAITFALGEQHGVVISTPADHGVPEGNPKLGNKNRQLKALAKTFNVELNQITFLDDDGNNVTEARKLGVTARHTPEGLTKKVLRNVARGLDETTAAEYMRERGDRAKIADSARDFVSRLLHAFGVPCCQ